MKNNETELWDELAFRKKTNEDFDKIEKSLRNVDPDLAECDSSQGALTITFADRSCCILSTQPSVRQIWLALAAKGLAYHFQYDHQQKKWFDDRGAGIELMSFLKDYLKKSAGVELTL